ncbi:ATP-dependent RNA helicase [Paractinoplanes atraurantiacus]|uniref:Helicase conserved C-terminal domain-containing protein n=1 Tax=Paractinoplanes atraurantiacus TaxID=1036182 RepID=A0A285JJA1_9ACTN|nr:ATP-dependent helicase C-terminal domain-containing protein [Actinoplanes atraurantiacus]SNY60364.1 Helicase conserved C-terminal domain-containing protein [Actinoplanes atraurantiacus]
MLIADDALPALPIRPVLPRVREALAAAGAAVLVAPPGTGKTTLVPLALADGKGRVVVAEPRRLAARAAARRMAFLLGERVGDRVGYTVRGDRQISRRTEIEVVTTGVLVRRLQRDPELAGTAAVILDECHERHLDTDLALAFLIEVRAALRPDLAVLATSATADADRLSQILGEAPVVAAESPLFPVEVSWSPPPTPITPPLGLRVDPRLLDHVAATVRRALTDSPGDILVFLPGAREIDVVAGKLAGVRSAPHTQPASSAAQGGGAGTGSAGLGGAGSAGLGGAGSAGMGSAGMGGAGSAGMGSAGMGGAGMGGAGSAGMGSAGMGSAGMGSAGLGGASLGGAGLGGGRADAGVEVIALHGRQPGAVQDAALKPGARRRVVLATAVAESSLTVPGVRVVVDAGLSRVPRMDHARGLGALATVPVSRAAAVQRAGRAGREAPGRVYRCWSEAQHDRLPAQPEPEIAAADLTGFALDLALWGHPDGTGLSLPDPPPSGALQSATATLRDLGAVDDTGRITPRGRSLADAGLHPRLARALLDGAPLVGPRRAAEIVALLDDDRTTTDDLVAAWRRARGATDPTWRNEVRRLTAALTRNPTDETIPDVTDAALPEPDDRAGAEGGDRGQADDREKQGRPGGRPADQIGGPANQTGGREGQTGERAGQTGGRAGHGGHAAQIQVSGPQKQSRGGGPEVPGRAKDGGQGRAEAGRGERVPDDLAAGLVVGLAYPERVARVREAGGRAYLMAGGTAAELTPGTGLAGVTWLAVAAADRAAGARTARIRAAAPLDEATAVEAAGTLAVEAVEIGWVDGDVVARRVRRLGAITLVERRLNDPDPALVRAALVEGLHREGLGLLIWSRTATELRERLAFAHAAMGEPWPDVSDEALLARAEDWLELGSARRRADLGKVDVASSLRRLLPWSVAGRLDEVAPERLPVPSGSRVRVDYSDVEAPVLAVKVQEAFGWRDAPRLADGRVPVLLHLLSPAGRPVAVTRDLASFWQQGYPQVRAELRGRYPRHPWPEDPTTAEPTRRAKPRSH